MRRSKITRVALITAMIAAMVGALSMSFLLTHTGAVHATPPISVTITTHVMADDVMHGSFAATAPLCPSGAFDDEFENVTGAPFATGPAQFTALINRTITCGDGSGTFIIQIHAHFPRLREGESTPWVVRSGTAAYATLKGTGTWTLDFTETGAISGDTLTGTMHFD